MGERVLVTGGVRSGKSRHAESLLTGLERVTYVAPGMIPDPAVDREWAARVAAHQAARPAHWVTVETADVPAALEAVKPGEGVIVDCLGTWLTRVLDDLAAWEAPREQWVPVLEERIAELAAAWQACRAGLAVAVTNEVGMGLVSEHRSGRIFADWLGRTNQALGAVSAVHLVVAGRVLEL